MLLFLLVFKKKKKSVFYVMLCKSYHNPVFSFVNYFSNLLVSSFPLSVFFHILCKSVSWFKLVQIFKYKHAFLILQTLILLIENSTSAQRWRLFCSVTSFKLVLQQCENHWAALGWNTLAPPLFSKLM